MKYKIKGKNIRNNKEIIFNPRKKKFQIKNIKTNITKKELSNPIILQKLLEKTNCKVMKMFEIKEYLDSGSESVVYKILEKVSKKTLIMKIIYRKQNEKRNINEFIISKKLKNKNISIFYGVEEIKEYNLDLVIIEYAIYNNLRFFQKKILKRNYLSESLLCFFAYQILNGLKYCHMNKIAHLDIKPENIVVDEFLNLKIIDFSVSLDYSKIKSDEIKLTFQGTNFYVAPEVIKEEVINVKDLNKVDLYSFGVMLYKLAYGSYPYGLTSADSHNYELIYSKIQNEKLEFNKKFVCSSYFIDFLKSLLENNINKRISINEALDHYWIKCSNILINEKENINNTRIFMTYLLTDHLIKFNNQIDKKF